ncbi:MAG TPA: hypothetical protein PKC10_10525 [Cyclobacteriaceae bacterium]|nr:hypothetical protein [Cyclobacteriaceae bacterium]
MKKTFPLFLTGLALCIGIACSRNVAPPNTSPKPGFRVLGYLHSYSNIKTDFQQVDLSLITDLNIAFVHPDTQGNFTGNPEYTNVISAAHNKNVRVFFSIGGNAATGKQFYATDSIKHFLRGALYFNSTPNEDSLNIVYNFLEKDMLHLVNTLKWK